eukprot:2572222-Prymnesium_polylepis.2
MLERRGAPDTGRLSHLGSVGRKPRDDTEWHAQLLARLVEIIRRLDVESVVVRRVWLELGQAEVGTGV